MTITDDVIADLLPLYTAGEASADTRAVVEEYLRAHPSFAAVVREVSDERRAAPLGVADELHAQVERTALERSRRLLRRRAWIMGLAIFFTMVPFSVASFESGGRPVTFLMMRDAPVVSGLFAAAAVVLWTLYYRLDRQLRSTGL